MLAALLTQTAGETPVDAVPLGGAVPTTTSAATALTVPQIDWPAMLPLIVLGLGAIVLLTLTSLLRKRTPRGFAAVFTIVVALGAAAAAVPLWARVQGWDHLFWWDLDTSTRGPFSTFGNPCVGTTGPSCGAVGIDGFSLGMTFVICIAIVLGALLSDGYLRREKMDGPELYALMLLSGAGGVLMAMANDLLVVFLGLETLSIAIYVLTAMHRRRAQSQEAGLKYFVLGSFASAFFLYGVALVFGATGSTNLIAIKNLLATTVTGPIDARWGVTLNSPLLLLGIGFLVVGLGFKAAAVPFHFWTPDIYDGAPSPVVAFMASAVKAAAIAALVRVLVLGLGTFATDWRPIIAALAILSMVVGAVLAVVQTNVKRTLAYSSISHMGFILMALYAASVDGQKAILFYVVAYLFMVAGAFGIVTLVSRAGDSRVSLSDYRGLAESNPALAFTFTVFLLGMAGVPFTSGFVAKLYTIIAAVTADAWWLAVVAAVSSAIAAFLYLRIIVSMYMTGSAEDGTMSEPGPGSKVPVSVGAGIALVICFFVTLWAGIFPGRLTDFASEGGAALVQVAPDPSAPAAGLGNGTQLSPVNVGAAAAAQSGTGTPTGTPTGR